MSLPTFVIVGAAKSGTTSLYHYLRQHPDVFLPDLKEPHFFVADRAFNFPVVRDLAAYRALFAEVRASAVGEASTAYLYYPEAPGRIHELLPDARIVILLRNPVDRAFSMYGHERREGLEPLSFEAALEAEERGPRSVDDVEYGFNYFRLGFAAEQVERYRELFGEERVFVALFDELAQDPAGLMRRLFAFLGVDPEYSGDWTTRHNPSGSPRYRWLHAFLDSRATWRRWAVAPLKLVLPSRARHEIWRRIREGNIRAGRRHRLEPETRARLAVRYEGEIRRLEELLERDLSSWRAA